MVENIAKQEIATVLLVKFAKAVIQIEKDQLKQKKLKYEHFRNRQRYSRRYL